VRSITLLTGWEKGRREGGRERRGWRRRRRRRRGRRRRRLRRESNSTISAKSKRPEQRARARV